jgi:hypothetical protein
MNRGELHFISYTLGAHYGVRARQMMNKMQFLQQNHYYDTSSQFNLHQPQRIDPAAVYCQLNWRLQ